MEHKPTIRPEADRLRIFDVLLESLDDGIWLWNIEKSKFDLLGKAAQLIFGSDLDMYNQDPEKWVYLIHPEDRERVLYATTQTLFSDCEIELEYRIEAEDGTYCWVSDSRKLIKNTAGIPVQVFGWLKDISTRKNHELRLEESELSYRVMFLHHPNPMWVVSCENGNILQANDAAVKHYGYTHKEFNGLQFADVALETEPNDITTLKDCEQRCCTHLLKSGKQIKVLLTTADYNYQKQQCKLILAIDVTREAEDEEKIKGLNKRLSDFEYALTSSTIVSITDTDGVIKYVNDNFVNVSGYQREELIGVSHKIVNSGYHPAAFFESMWAHISKGQIWRSNIRNKAKNGTLHWVDTSIVPLLDHEGKPVEFISIRNNISQQKKMEEELAELNKHLEERVHKRTHELQMANNSLQGFANSISHDLRAPVRHIRHFAQIVLDDSKGTMSNESLKFQNYVIAATLKLSEQIDGLLQFSRVGSKAMNFVTIDTHKMVLYIMDQCKLQFPHTTCHFALNQPLPQINADYNLLELVFTNLFSNAIKFSSKKQESYVWLNYTDLGDYHQFEIKDNGAGFDMLYAPKLFTLFSRLHSESEFEGNGIGLVNVQKIVERHQGKVWLESTLGEGTSCFFTISNKLMNENAND